MRACLIHLLANLLDLYDAYARKFDFIKINEYNNKDTHDNRNVNKNNSGDAIISISNLMSPAKPLTYRTLFRFDHQQRQKHLNLSS